MNETDYIKLLNNFSSKTNYRQRLVSCVLEDKNLIVVLFDQIENAKKQQACLASRTLELVCKKNLRYILPHLNEFSKLLSITKYDAIARAFAKIMELLTIQYFIKSNAEYIDALNPCLEAFTEACFDYMISDKETAVQAHSMYALYLLGEKFDWIHPELLLLIEKGLPTGSTGYKSRGRKIIKAIKTNTKYKL